MPMPRTHLSPVRQRESGYRVIRCNCALQILDINQAGAILESLRPALILGVRL
jgi:hypothetical protein